MSVLETPRILFKGEISWDPITTNNYDTLYNEDTDEPIFPAVADKVRAFRAAAVAAVPQVKNATQPNGNWNPAGTHRSTFFRSAISGVDLGSGTSTDDAFVASAANFSGMLVDLEPFGAFTSQLFFNTMHFGIDGGYRILCKRRSRVTARYVNFGRNPANSMIAGVASVVWQTSFAKQDGVRIHAFDSAALNALQVALQADDVQGLTVRFNTYRTIYYDNPALSNFSALEHQEAQELVAKLNLGGFQPNPARSLMVGVIGLWRKGEPAHEPCDRALLPPANSNGVASAFARAHGTTLTLDLSNSLPEVSRDARKKDLGTLEVAVVDAANGSSTTLGTIPYTQYNRAAYEAGSGIVTLPLSPEQVQAIGNRDLQLRDGTGAVLLAEQALRAVPEMGNVYLNEGETGTVAFQLYNRGIPARGQRLVTVYKMSADGGSIENTNNLQTNADGVLSFSVSAVAGGVFAYVPSPTPGAPAPSNGIDPQLYTYAYVRVLAADASVAALPPTWENVYAHVLANWNAMAPCMDNWLMLDNPIQVKSYAGILKKLTDPANFEDYRYMPVTRDMTAGERTLLYKFLDAPGDGTSVAFASVAPRGANFAKSSGAMRRP